MSTASDRFEFINIGGRDGVLVIAITVRELRDSKTSYALRDEMISANASQTAPFEVEATVETAVASLS